MVRFSSATSRSRRARFDAVQDSLSFFRSVYDAFAGYRAAIIRLDGLVTANETARELPSLTAVPSTDGSLAARRRRGPDAGWDTAHRSARRAARSGRVDGDHRHVGQRQDHPAAQPGAAVAVHVGHAAPPRGRHHVPVPAALHAAGGSARGGLAIPPRKAGTPTTRSGRPSTRCRSGIWAAGSTRWPTGRRCCRPASSSGSRSPVCCWPNRRWSSSTRRRPRSTKARSSRCTGRCAPSCPTASWSASAIVRTLDQHHDRRLELLGDGAWRLAPV